MRNKILASTIAACCCLMSSGATLALPAQEPLFLVPGVESQVMINMSNDHQLFYKAYDDWSDIDPVPDGIPESTYKHTIDYFGYFDPYKCYSYDTTDNRFEPEAKTGTKYCDTVSGDWSGNFLNWASMTRIDTVRKILYGGLRSTDTGSTTVLERSYLPGDAHSFAKYYEEATAGEMAKLTPWSDSEITICNTTYAADGDSEDRTEPPLLRVASGNFALWAANERFQCHWQNKGELESNIFNSPNPNTNNGNHTPTTGLNAEADNPDWTADRLGQGDFIARVEACVTGLVVTEKCKQYPNGNLKPIGLLQEYGEGGEVHFGLMTGSFQNNKSGGTLRKNIGTIDDEINVATDGTFKTPPAAGNIIGNLSALRVSGYDHNPGYYNVSDNCAWGQNSFSNGECTNWGNPQSEIYLESLRYLAGESADFNANDTGFVNNLISASSWTDPLSNTNHCAPVKIVQFNASVTSFDGDNLGGASDIGIGSVATWTDKVGAATGEGIAGNPFFIGEGSATTTTDGICTAKTVNNLSDAVGLCPEAPRLEGGYDIAGLAYYAYTQTIRTDLTDADGNQADINVETFGVTLAPAVPKIEVPVPGSNKVVTILPACRNQSIGGNCAIVDFKIVEPHREFPPNSGKYIGKFYVNWEDSEQGGDYDQDMAGVLSYEVTSTTIAVTTSAFADSTGNRMAFGYIISGTTQDGFHAHSGINFFTAYNDPTGVLTCSNAAIDCETGEPATSVVYTIGNSSGTLLKDPLYYASKWGGFYEESDPALRPPMTAGPNDIPDQAYEWDADGDQLPDNYFFSRNPGQLNSQLGAVFQAVSTTSSSASVVANTVSLRTTTRIYQARFNSADWSGSVVSFPVDPVTGALKPVEWDVADILKTQDYDTGREIITWDQTANSGAGAGVPFRWANLNTAQQLALDTNPVTLANDGLGSSRVDYLRGDASKELKTAGTFRSRNTPLGDVVNSTPTVVGAPLFGYPDSMETVPYSTFKAAYDDVECYLPNVAQIPANLRPVGDLEREPILYFGGNDGALHGVSACSGEERIAYVPKSVYSQLGKLTSQDYQHRYFVDGPSTVVDAYWSGAWHTVLVGTLRGGGKGVFALDVTDPSKFDETYASQLALWDIEATPGTAGSDFEELGYTYSQPSVVKVDGLGWVALFGNGYHGKSGKAILYVVRINDGTLLQTIDLSATGPGSGSHGTGNGLSTVAPVDTDGDGDADLVYGGDLNGNLWRFAKTGTTGFSRAQTTLLYSAKSAGGVAQPITSRMAVGYHPTSAVGRIVMFGTGKYYELLDQDPANAVTYNTMYGIWDRDYALSPNPAVASVVTRDSNILQKQTITNTQVTTFGANTETIRLVSNTPIQWAGFSSGTPETCAVNKSCGWYLDLTDTGEKMVAAPILRAGKLIFVTTVPSPQPCAGGGSGWLMEIDPNTGGALDVPVLDLNGDGLFDFNDMLSTTTGGVTTYIPVTGVKSKVGIIQAPAILAGVGGPQGGCKNCEGKYFSGSQQGQIDVKTENALGSGEGRKSWVRIE